MHQPLYFVLASIVAGVFAAPGLSQNASSETPLEQALKPWVLCLNAEAKRLKDSGLTADVAVNGAYAKCGDGQTSLDKALTVLDKDKAFSAAEIKNFYGGARLTIRSQVLAGITGLPLFSFRELIAGHNFSMESPGFKKCQKSPTTVVCTELFDSVAGVPAITSYTIYNRKLSQFWISTDRGNLPTLLLAFNQKYGKPCDSKVKEVQNKMGNTFKSAEMTWCFATGKMIASEIGSRITQSSIIYTDDFNSTPSSPAKIDF